MTTTINEAGEFERLVTLELTDADIDSAKASAARRLSKDMRIPGFRPGKAPRPVVEAAIGTERLRTEAIEDLIPQKLGSVLEEAQITPAVAPSLEKVDEVDGGVNVEVRVTLWPTVSDLPDYQGQEIEVDSTDLTDEELEANVTRLREQFASLETVERPAQIGDFVSVDISAEVDETPVEEASAAELLYEIGSGLMIEGADDQLRGTSAGDEVTLESPLPPGFGDRAGIEAKFTLKVNEVKAKVLPDLDDEWVDEVTEFETVEELRSALRDRLLDAKRRNVANQFREKVIDRLVAEAGPAIPERLVQAEMEEVLHRFVHRLETQEISFQDYLDVTGLSEDAFLDDLHQQAERSLQTRILLDAVAKAEDIKIDPSDLANAIELMARSSEQPDQVRRAFQNQSQVLSLAGDILRNKALEAVVTAARAVDSEGNLVELELPELELTVGEGSGEFEAEVVEGQIVESDEAAVVEAEIVDEEA